MTQTIGIESFGTEDPAVAAWREAFVEAARVVPETVEAIAQKIGNILLRD